MRSLQIILTAVTTACLWVTTANAEDAKIPAMPPGPAPIQGTQVDFRAVHEACLKEVGVKPGTPMTKDTHMAIQKCLMGKGVNMPGQDPGREKAFNACADEAKIQKGKIPSRDQFKAVHECMEKKGFKNMGAPMGMHGGMHPPMPGQPNNQSTPGK